MTHKGKKFYGVIHGKHGFISFVDEDIEQAKKGLNNDSPTLVELTVTRAFVREKELKEIENEIPVNQK